MFILLVAVIATSAGVLYWFFNKLKFIEVELWGEKRQEAENTAMAAENGHKPESDNNTTEH
jgi:flagellar basal body-associated protein FliL